jgi:DNA-binding MarR family transcriptional regulator
MKYPHYIDSLPYELVLTSRIIHEAIDNLFEEKNFGISHDEYIILDTIYCHPNILQIDLAKLILKGRAHTGRFLMALEDKGLVTRTPARKGRKLILLNNITPKGLKLCEHVSNVVEKEIEDMNSCILEEKIDEVVNSLKFIREYVASKHTVKFN